ncbi:hypothetical protein CLOSTMETH_01119 [[Clostridium] methylpentosum DSM 5476]|uniref:Uncharacterized protein n=1 Tax=[Clostridium] methylpentosum DSM 5476 TaxID=537013 RepID=C0EBA1_9FIRM|nr:hypothetical protein CLOSTMETH_01119 [[Clostridium] methylpentosum DSM 5476]MDY3988070.1 hypothetical protein [Massilioclostridium sp.]MEE1492058.1 hypothetical protein [Massilioclostridium sp.]
MAGTKTSEISSFMKSMVYSGAFNEKLKKGSESYHMLNEFAWGRQAGFPF